MKFENAIDLNINFVAVEFENRPYEGVQFYEYKVEFDSETSDRVRERFIAVEKHPEIGKGAKSFNGTTLVMPRRLTQLEHKYGEYLIYFNCNFKHFFMGK